MSKSDCRTLIEKSCRPCAPAGTACVAADARALSSIFTFHTPMLDKPDLQDERSSPCLQVEYGLRVTEIAFLAPRRRSEHGRPIASPPPTTRRPVLSEYLGAASSTKLPWRCPVPQRAGHRAHHRSAGDSNRQLWARLEPLQGDPLPICRGPRRLRADLSDRHWIEFGAALKRQIHTVVLPPALINPHSSKRLILRSGRKRKDVHGAR